MLWRNKILHQNLMISDIDDLRAGTVLDDYKRIIATLAFCTHCLLNHNNLQHIRTNYSGKHSSATAGYLIEILNLWIFLHRNITNGPAEDQFLTVSYREARYLQFKVKIRSLFPIPKQSYHSTTISETNKRRRAVTLFPCLLKRLFLSSPFMSVSILHQFDTAIIAITKNVTQKNITNINFS